jgi:hypothetical protein
MNRNTWLLLSVVLAVGCGVSVESFPKAAAKAYCGQVYKCCAMNEVADAGAVSPDEATCNTNVSAQLDGKTGLLKSEQSKGRLDYHGDIAQSCVDKLAALKCQELKVAATATPTECSTYAEPKTAIGGACQLSESCIGSWCSGATITADGVCTAFVPSGESCANGGQCISGTFCSGGICAGKKADGASCSSNFECSTGGCNDKNPDGGVGTCGVRGGSGTTCFVTQGCSAAGSGALILMLLTIFLIRPARPARS